MTKNLVTPRRFIIGSTLGVSSLALTGCDALAREFSETDISPSFGVNGSSMPDSEEYAALLENNFADWRLKIDRLVVRPREFSLAELKRSLYPLASMLGNAGEYGDIELSFRGADGRFCRRFTFAGRSVRVPVDRHV
jgi:hypothetical protein